MASLLELVKHYQNNIEKCHEEKNILKCIDALSGLDVTVQHLQDTGVGRTVNALRKESGKVGLAARSLVNKWKAMVVAEDSDQDASLQDTTTYNGSGKDSDYNTEQLSRKHDKPEKSSSHQNLVQKEHSVQINGNHRGSKRKYSSEEEHYETKKSNCSNSSDDYSKIKPDINSKRKYSESDSNDSDSESDESESDFSEEEVRVKQEIKEEKPDKHKSSKPSLQSYHGDKKNDLCSSKQSNHSVSKHSDHYTSQSKERHYNEKASSKEVSHNSDKAKSAKEKESSIEKKHKSDLKSPNVNKSYKESKHSSNSSSTEKHKSSSSSHKDETNDKYKSSSEKHSSKSDKHKSSKDYESTKKEKQKSTSEKETSKHKSKDRSSSNEDKHSSSSKEKSKERDSSSSLKEKSNSEKRYSSSSVKSDGSTSKSNSEKSSSHSSEKKSRHKSSSSDNKGSKSSSSKTKEDVPKKKVRFNEEDSEDGIDCGSGASFAEALGMISPTKPKKKYSNGKDTQSPTNSFMNDLSPAALLAPTAKLAPLPALEISALPEISPNYKPRPPPKCLPHFTDEEAISVGISTKNQRTKVYSGNKILGKVPTLYELCVDILQEHIDALEYTGGVPYEILKPVVDRATPQQLFTLEHYNPYLMEDTDHLWKKFCEKNFRKQQRQELESWREMYLRCQEEQEYRLKSLTANIRIAQEAKKAPIKQTKMAYVDTVVKPPRSIARKQAQHGTAHASTASPAARVAALASAANVLRPGSVRPPPATAVSTSTFQKPKKAPLMQKALQFMRGRKR